MELNESKKTHEHAAERLAWHAPVIQRLDVQLDTRSAAGSGGDAENMTYGVI